MLFALSWPDYTVVLVYICLLAGMGWYFARKQRSNEEYFLAGRNIPWFAVGLSIIATLLSSLTYLSEPGEVWQSGITTLLGKAGAILTEMVFVLTFFIPFLMRFRFTSAYEYLGVRFGTGTRWWGVILFVCLVVSWMGFVVLAMSRAVSKVADVPLEAVIATVGVVGTIYTMAGGIRAVIWKEVLQVILMIGGCFVCMGYVIWATDGAWLPDWIDTALEYRATQEGGTGLKLFSLDPFERISVFSFGLTMFVWHFCTHLGNQMVVQRYFSCSDLKTARRSFVTAALFGLIINALLVFVGLALLYFYQKGYGSLTLNPRVKRDADLIFPTFMVQTLPAGLGGAVLTAVLSAAMSTIDSGINAIATVISVERKRLQGDSTNAAHSRSQIRFARLVTLGAGFFITLSAFAINILTKDRNILEMMPRSFNCFLIPLGGLFILGMFAPFCGARATVTASVCSLATAIGIAYAKELFGLPKEVSFTWVLPGALFVLIAVALLISPFDRPRRSQVKGLTWFGRREVPDIDRRLLAPWVFETAEGKTG
jgi:SSS family solute:Na+ symporter